MTKEQTREQMQDIKIGHLYRVFNIENYDMPVNHVVKIVGSNGKTGYNAKLIAVFDNEINIPWNIGSFYYYFNYDSYIGPPEDFPEYFI